MESQLPPLQIPHHPRVPSTCDLHPGQHVTGFCASCLRERLAGLEIADADAAHRKSTSALKSVFFKASGGGNGQASSFLPELRRCKSFSATRANGSASAAHFEPQRRSCDVRGRNTLWSLFHQDDRDKAETVIEPRRSFAAPVIEAREEEERDDIDDNDDEIRPANPNLVIPNLVDSSREMKESEVEEETEVKTIKDHIDLESQSKKLPFKEPKEIGGSFWLAASVFSKKLQSWRRKQKLKKHRSKPDSSSTRQEKAPNHFSRRSRETQSEIAVDAFGRRSCDIDPRFSLDASRMSFDDPRPSWDAPRASWDGYLTGARSVFPRLPPMLSVVEDNPRHTPKIERWDSRIPVEEDSVIPGGSVQTRDYYLDSSSRRRNSLDRSNSVRTQSVESIELKPVPNAKVSPTESKLDREPRDLSSNSLRDDYSESFETAFRDPHKGGQKKKSWWWSKRWSIWGFMYRHGSSREGGANVVERSFSESWPELRVREYNSKVLRSNSNVSSRISFRSNSGFGSTSRTNIETNGHGKKRREEFVLERNRSARYSPTHVDNGLLRFYLTPMRGSRRNGLSTKSRHDPSYSLTRTVLGMY